MRGVGADVGKEGLFLLHRRLDELTCCGEEDVGAEALGRLHLAVVEVVAVEVGVVPQVGGLPHAATAVPVDLSKAAIFRPVGKVVAEVPLAKHARGVAGIAEQLAEGHLVFPQHRATVDRVPHAGAIGPVARHQSGPRRRTGRGHVVVGEARRLSRQGVEMRCLNHRVARVPKIAIPLVVCHHEHDIRPRHIGSRCRPASPHHHHRKPQSHAAPQTLLMPGYSATTAAVCSAVVRPGGSSRMRMLRKWISAPSDSRQR